MMLIGPDGAEAEITRAAMNNEYLTLSVKNDSRKKVMFDTTAINDIAEAGGAYHIDTADKGKYILTARRITAESLVEWIQRGKSFLIDTETMHLSFNGKPEIKLTKSKLTVIRLKRDPIFPELKKDNYDKLDILLSGTEEITVINDYTVKFAGTQLTILNY